MTSTSGLASIPEAMADLAVSRSTIDRMCADGQLTRIKVRGVVRVRWSELQAIKDGQSVRRRTSRRKAS